MEIEQAIMDRVRTLPADKKEAVLAYVEQLTDKPGTSKPPRMSGRGLWADLNIDLTAEDIDEARKEMWKNFPRDDF
jgi:hypothetical protein